MPSITGALPLIIPSFPPGDEGLNFMIPILTSVFITSSSIVVAYISTRGYRSGRLLSLLLLSCGALVFGCTSLLSATFAGTLGVDFAATVFATGALLSAAFHLGCSSLTYLGGAPSSRRGHQVALWTALALLSVSFLVIAGLGKFFPSFYVNGSGTSSVGQVTLAAAMVIFATSAAVIYTVFISSRSAVLYWYSMALGATAAGLLGVIISRGDPGVPAMWAGWGALYLSGAFLVKSLLSAERLRDLPLANSGR